MMTIMIGVIVRMVMYRMTILMIDILIRMMMVIIKSSILLDKCDHEAVLLRV